MTSYVTREKYDALVARLDKLEQMISRPASVYINPAEVFIAADALERGRKIMDMISARDGRNLRR